MIRSSRSPSNSPARKRQRLSSPTYDTQLGDLSQEDIDAFDAIDAKLSQSPTKCWPGNSQECAIEGAGVGLDNMRAKTGISGWGRPQLPNKSAVESSDALTRLQDDPDNPFSTSNSLLKLGDFGSASTIPIMEFASASMLPKSGFPSASSINRFPDSQPEDYDRSPSPEVPPPEPDYDAWFDPAPADVPVAFQTATFASAAVLPTEGLSTPLMAFATASNKAIVPSSSALAKAREKLKDIWSENGEENSSTVENVAPQLINTKNTFKVPFATSPKRPALRALENSFNSPSTPSPSGFSRPSIANSVPAAAISSPSLKQPNPHRPKPFKSPLLKRPTTSTHGASGYAASPLNPNRLGGFTPASQRVISSENNPNSSSTIQVVSKRPDTSTIPSRPGLTRRLGPTSFMTPFKPGIKPREAGENALSTPPIRITGPAKDVTPVNRAVVQVAKRYNFFDLTKRPDRQTLETCGLTPGQQKPVEMFSDYEDLKRMTPDIAMYYTFHRSVYSPLHSIFPEPHESLGPPAAYTELQRRGCTLATKEWVDNHWSLLLWKLAGMALLSPTQEMSVETRRWSWAGIMYQLLYRYERELNCGDRPPLRMIATQDMPASLPMVLCVSNIFWSEGGIAEDGTPVEPYPELELTDGWYKLKAKIDPPMARAVRRGIIATGRKVGITGAWLSCEKKEPMEILEAYNSVKLVVSANSSHLVPWHHKLGFKHGGPFLATLNKLSPDGGNICALDAIVLKMYPIAYIEFREDENGNKVSEGPRNEAEEAKVSEDWRRRREVEASKLREALEKKQARFEGYIDRLERKAGPRFHPGEDEYPPDNVDNLFDELEDPTEAGAVIGRLSPKDAGWLAQHIRRRLESDRERVGEEIEKELESICPPRSVRNFRVIVVKDGSTMRHPSNRTAQITVWDVMNLSFYEGEPGGTFQVGHRYMVTNLNPTHHTSWMGRYEEGAEVYMATGRHSRWRKLNKYGFAV